MAITCTTSASVVIPLSCGATEAHTPNIERLIFTHKHGTQRHPALSLAPVFPHEPGQVLISMLIVTLCCCMICRDERQPVWRRSQKRGTRSSREAAAALSHHDVWHLRSLPQLFLPALSIHHGTEPHASFQPQSECFSTDRLSIGSPEHPQSRSGLFLAHEELLWCSELEKKLCKGVVLTLPVLLEDILIKLARLFWHKKERSLANVEYKLHTNFRFCSHKHGVMGLVNCHLFSFTFYTTSSNCIFGFRKGRVNRLM